MSVDVVDNAICKIPVKCTGKPKTDKTSVMGTYYGWIVIDGRKWAIVRWEGDEDPDLYKAELLLISESTMVSIR